MKNRFLLLSFLLMTVTASAQVSWNARAGLNLSNVTNSDANMKVGFNIGAGMDYAFTDLLSLQPSLLFTTKGATVSEGEITGTVNAMYLELPVLLAARIPVNQSVNVVITVGPYAACGVGGKASISSKGVSISVDTFGEDNYNRFDAGIATGLALEFSKFFVGLNGEFGLTNLNPADTGGDGKNVNYYLGVGYKF
ncbi:MAG: PorT family protein [Prevotellaceae bacterium]|jgi:hypothetical protein|nr:PorT family protein [Prevotellaceae bacterium]